MQSKKYSTPLGSEAVVAVIEIDVVPVEAGTLAHVAGSGVGGVVSAGVSVVADSEVDHAVAFWLVLLSLDCTR